MRVRPKRLHGTTSEPLIARGQHFCFGRRAEAAPDGGSLGYTPEPSTATPRSCPPRTEPRPSARWSTAAKTADLASELTSRAIVARWSQQARDVRRRDFGAAEVLGVCRCMWPV